MKTRFFNMYYSPDEAGPAPDTGILDTPPETPTTEPAVDTPWYSTIEDESIRGHAELKGWKSAEDVVKSYMNAEKKIGAPPESMVRIPDQMNNENLMPIYDKLGRPETVEGYELTLPEGGDKEFSDGFMKIAHENGLSKTQVQELAKWNDTYLAEITQKSELEATQNAELELKNLQDAWGNQYDANESMAKNAAKTFGLDDATLTNLESTLGFAKTMELFANIGSKLTDHKFIDGKSPDQMQLTPSAAKAKYESLKNDKEFVKAMNMGDTKALQEWNRTLELMTVGR